MSKPNPIILKIGGSVITDKKGELAAKTAEINRLAEEIQQAGAENLVIVHGGGSFGHPVAERHAIKDGFKKDSQKSGFSETHHVMTVLNGLVMDSLIWHDVPAVSVTPSSCIVTENGRVQSFEDLPTRSMLNLGFTPVFYGDAVLDTKLGFTILSGDQLVSVLATRFNAKNIVIGIDEDGVFDCDPKLEKGAKLFERLTPGEMERLEGKLGAAVGCDVTGGMLGKMKELDTVVKKGIPVTILNATRPRYIYKALRGEHVQGTTLQRE